MQLPMYYDRKVLTRLCNHTSPNTRKTPKTLVRGHRNLWGYERFHFDPNIISWIQSNAQDAINWIQSPLLISCHPLFFSKSAQPRSRHNFSRLIRPLFVPPAFFLATRSLSHVGTDTILSVADFFNARSRDSVPNSPAAAECEFSRIPMWVVTADAALKKYDLCHT